MSPDDKQIQDFKKKIASQISKLKKQSLEQFNNRITNLERNIATFAGQMIRGGLVGITSSGKSALLNTLLGTGTQILKEQSKATTNMIVFCSKSKDPELEIFFENDESIKKEGKGVLEESIWKYTSEDENPQNKLGVKFIKLSLPSFMLEKGLEIADTPGLDAFGHKEHEDLTLREFLPQANLILYLSSVRSPMKETDRKIIDRIMDADQRIIFVQTCKGAVVEQKVGGEVTQSVEEQLKQYKDKLKEAISHYENLKDAPIVQVETTDAMESYKKKDKNLWKRSGLDELTFVVSETTKQIKSEFKLINLRRIVDESLAVQQLINNILKEEDDKASALESQTLYLGELKTAHKEIIEDKDKLKSEWDEKLDIEALYARYHEELSELYTDRYNFNPMHDEKFLAKAQSIEEELMELKSEFLDSIDGAKKKYTQVLTELGMDVRRIDYQDINKHALFLPNVQKKRVAEKLDDKKYDSMTDEYVDKNRYIKDLEGSLRLFFTPLTKHLEWWRNAITLSFEKPLEKKIDSITDDIKNVKQGISCDDAQKEVLAGISNGIDVAVQEVIPIFDKGAIGRKIKAYSRYIGKMETVELEDKNIFLQLSNRLFENLYHSHYLQCLDKISSKKKKSVLLIGQSYDSLINLLRRLMRLDQSSVDLLLESDPPYTINAARKLKKIQNIPLKGELKDKLTFFVLTNDDQSYKVAQSSDLFAKADVVQVVIDDLHRVGSALRDMVERLVFFKLVNLHREKLLITYPAAAHFQKNKLHLLAGEVVPEVGKIFQPDPIHWFIYENFETRYGYFCQLARKMKEEKLKVTEVLDEWKLRGLPLDEPFTEDVLMDQFEMATSIA